MSAKFAQEKKKKRVVHSRLCFNKFKGESTFTLSLRFSFWLHTPVVDIRSDWILSVAKDDGDYNRITRIPMLRQMSQLFTHDEEALRA